jgi:Asp-tRNA(Asn)/Glu-tRNA(Gln) amidotransferase A subunit family amidase
MPTKPYATFATGKRLDGMRIGVLREYMNKKLFSVADEESIDIVNREIEVLRKLGATIVDPGAEAVGFQFDTCLQLANELLQCTHDLPAAQP